MADSDIAEVNIARFGEFQAEIQSLDSPDVLEIGTLQWPNEPARDHQDWVPNAGTYIKSDVEAGNNVDIVSDVHDLKEFEDNSFDVVLAISVWEHIPKPWVAAYSIERVLKPGGYAFIQTHQTFPLHGYPHDYFRFSTEALSMLFAETGLTVESGYVFPCKIVPPKEVTRWNTAAESYLNVYVIARKNSIVK